LLHEVIISQTVLELRHRATCLCREYFAPDPHQQRTAEMMALEARLAALAAFQPGHLCACAVQLLHLPADAARLLCGRGGILSQVVGHDVVRAVGRHRLAGESCVGDDGGQHLAHMIARALPIAVGLVDARVHQPALVRVGIDIHARHHPEALEDGLGMATLLSPHQCDGARGVLVEHRVITQHGATRGRNDLSAQFSQTSRGVIRSPHRERLSAS
jgi:hypothetical protein